MSTAYIDDFEFEEPDEPDEPNEAGSHALDSSHIPRAVAAEPGTRAVIYLRVSSSAQVNTDYDPEGISIPAQRVACRRKADQLGLAIVDEYIEPGRSGTEMTRRVAFQQMLTRVRNEKDVDFVIVYKLSRMARNRYDDAIVMADLRKRGVSLISATESIDDSPVGQLMHGILATFNEYQSRESGADIAYKMGQKAKNGGTLGRAPLGYLNVYDRSTGREIRTVAHDPERAEFVKLAFELYATGEYTLADLSDELYDRGLRTRPTTHRPAQQVSMNKLSLLLRDRYYLGVVTYRGEEYEGRHEPLIDEDLFGRVQEVIESRGVAAERRRVHHHFLKGSVYCGRCRDAGVTSRLIVQHVVNRRGYEYTYFFCINKQGRGCATPHVNVIRVEDAVEDHYATIRFTPEFIADVRAQIANTIADDESATRLLKKHLSTQLLSLDAQEANLIDLAADASIPQAKIKQRLRAIEQERRHLSERLAAVSDEIADGLRLLEACLTLLADPQELYRRCDDEQRRLLNQALFHRLYVDHDRITDHELREPFDRVHAAHSEHSARGGPVTARGSRSADPEAKRAASTGDGSLAFDVIRGLLTDFVSVSSKPRRVELRGLEPLTPSMPWRCATSCATAPLPRRA